MGRPSLLCYLPPVAASQLRTQEQALSLQLKPAAIGACFSVKLQASEHNPWEVDSTRPLHWGGNRGLAAAVTEERTLPACSQLLPLPQGGATPRYTAVAPPKVVGSGPLRNSQQQPKESDV